MSFTSLIPWAEADAQREQQRTTQWRDAQRTQTIGNYMATANQITRQLGYVDNLHKALALVTDPNTHQIVPGHEAEATRLRDQLGQYDVNALHANLNQVQGYIQRLYDPNFNPETGMLGRSPIRALGEKLHLVKPQASPLAQPLAAAQEPQAGPPSMDVATGLPNLPPQQPPPKPQTAGELMRGLRAIRQKYDIAAPGIETGEKELEGEAAQAAKERATERDIEFTRKEAEKYLPGDTETQQSLMAAKLGGYKPTAPKTPTVKQIYQGSDGKQYVEYNTGEFKTPGGDEVSRDVLNQIQLTPLSKGGAANLKLGTLAYFLNSAYGPNPTPQQQIEGNRIWTEARAIERQSDGTVLWTDSNDQTWQIPTTRTTKPVPSGLAPPAPYQPPATPGPIQIGVGGQTFTGQQGTGAPVVESITPTGTPQITPGAASATGATDVTTAPQSPMPTTGGSPAATGPTPPVPGARRLGTKRSPEETAAAKVADQMETDVNAVNDYMQQRRAGQKSATSDTTIVLSWVRAQVRGAGRMTNPEIEQGLQSGSYATRFLNAYNRAKDGTLDDSFIEQMVGDITRAAKAARQTADKYKSGGSGQMSDDDFLKKF